MKLTFSKLRRWNIGVGVVQLVCSAIIFGITDYDLKTPWFTFFIASREADEPADFYRPVPKSQADVPVGVLSAIFLLLSALDHFAVTLPGVNNVYNAQICRNRNIFRWIEYFCTLLLSTVCNMLDISASLMRVQIAMLTGVTDIHLIYAIFGLTATTMLFGWLMETTNGDRLATYEITDKKDEPPKAIDAIELGSEPPSSHQGRPIDWTPLAFGFVPHFFAWTIILCVFFEGVSNGDPPGFVWAIIWILLLLDLCFAIVQTLQFAHVKGFRDFAHAEFAYILLSLTAKQLLAWIELGGAESLDE